MRSTSAARSAPSIHCRLRRGRRSTSGSAASGLGPWLARRAERRIASGSFGASSSARRARRMDSPRVFASEEASARRATVGSLSAIRAESSRARSSAGSSARVRTSTRTKSSTACALARSPEAASRSAVKKATGGRGRRWPPWPAVTWATRSAGGSGTARRLRGSPRASATRRKKPHSPSVAQAFTSTRLSPRCAPTTAAARSGCGER
ncbi:MAG: hypothetical protein M5U28_21870 [Sandaracinaceae bacterium]|nr:hypothetical protein [Sandaracinaceae bacterium]